MRSIILFALFTFIATTSIACSDDSFPVTIPVPEQHIELTSEQICNTIPEGHVKTACQSGASLPEDVTIDLTQITLSKDQKLAKTVDFRKQFKDLPNVVGHAAYAINSVEISAKVTPSKNNIGLDTPPIDIQVSPVNKQAEAVPFATIPSTTHNKTDAFTIQSTSSTSKEATDIIKKFHFDVIPKLPKQYIVKSGTHVEPKGRFEASVKPEVTVNISVSKVFQAGFEAIADLF